MTVTVHYASSKTSRMTRARYQSTPISRSCAYKIQSTSILKDLSMIEPCIRAIAIVPSNGALITVSSLGVHSWQLRLTKTNTSHMMTWTNKQGTMTFTWPIVVSGCISASIRTDSMHPTEHDTTRHWKRASIDSLRRSISKSSASRRKKTRNW